MAVKLGMPQDARRVREEQDGVPGPWRPRHAVQALTGQARLQKTLQKGTVLQNAGKGRERCFCLFVRLFLPVEVLGRLQEEHEALDWVLKTR